MTTLPERLRASALIERVIERLQMDIDDGSRPDQWSMQAMQADLRNALRIARELEEAAQALEAQPLTLDQRYWLDRRAEIIDALAADGLQICSDKDKVWLRRSAPPSAQVAQEGDAGVATDGGGK